MGASPDSAEKRPGRVRELYPALSFTLAYSSELDTACEFCVCLRCDTISLRLCRNFDAGSHSVAVDWRFSTGFPDFPDSPVASEAASGFFKYTLLTLQKMHGSTGLITVTISSNPLSSVYLMKLTMDV